MPQHPRRRLVAGTATGLALAWAGARSALAQDGPYPNRAVRYVVPYAPGGPTDNVGRLIAAELANRWKQPVVVENRAGANAIIGAEHVARSAPDGYTLLQGTSSTHGSNPALYPRLPYNAAQDFVPVVPLIEGPLFMGVGNQSAARTVADIIAQARARPGKLNYGTPGAGSPQHLAGELLKLRAGIDIMPVHYKGAAPAMLALQAGEVDMTFDSTAIMHARAGRMRVLGVTTRQRWPLAQEVPTLIEAGVPDFEVRGWFALFAPRGTPADVVERINAAVNDALAVPEVRQKIEAMGYRATGGPVAAFAQGISRELAYWAELVRANQIKVD